MKQSAGREKEVLRGHFHTGSNFIHIAAHIAKTEPFEDTGYGIDGNHALYVERRSEELMFLHPCMAPDVAAEVAEREARRSMPTLRNAADGVTELRLGPAYCYLAFFGHGNRCRYVKVGLSSHPERRMQHMSTDNPLDLLAIYACQKGTRAMAYGLEQAMLRATRSIHCRGEWLMIDECEASHIPAVAASLAGGVASPYGERLRFEPVWAGVAA